MRHDEKQSPDAAVKEDETAYHTRAITLMGVPVKLVLLVRALIAKQAG